MSKSKQQEQLAEQIDADMVRVLGEYRNLLYNATPGQRSWFANFEKSLQDARISARGARLTAERFAADDTLYPQGRRRLIEEARDKALAEQQAHLAAAGTMLAALKQSLRASLLPHLDPAREMPARDELRLILDHAADPFDAMAKIVQDGGELAAVACSSYGESYLRAQGVTHSKDAHGVVVDTAYLAGIKAGARSDDPQTRAAALAAGKLDELESVVQGARYEVAEAMQDAADIGASVVGVGNVAP
jgi:outer membrane murein-binding lipoprotein Lpp